MKKTLVWLGGLMLLLPFLAVTGVSAKVQKVPICHVLPEEASHEYQFLKVPQKAVDGKGKNDHSLHERDGLKDIIPIGDINDDGKINQEDCDEQGNGGGEECDLTAPGLVVPANGAVNVATHATLKWNAVEGADTYELQYSYTSDFAKDTIVPTSYTQLTLDFPAGKTVYWKVRAIIDNKEEDDCVSAFSTAWNFKTLGSGVGGGEEEEGGKGGGVAVALPAPSQSSGDEVVLEGFGAGPGVLPATGASENAGLIFSLISSGVVTWLIRKREVLGG